MQDSTDNLLKKLNFIEFNDINLPDSDCKKTILLHELPFVSPKLKGLFSFLQNKGQNITFGEQIRSGF